jgi:hypothetical protein
MSNKNEMLECGIADLINDLQALQYRIHYDYEFKENIDYLRGVQEDINLLLKTITKP